MNNKIKKIALVLVFGLSASVMNASDKLPVTKSAIGTNLYIISPVNGSEVSETFDIKFGLSGMGVAPAGVDKPNTGHHHLIIDGKALPKAGVPMGSNVKHFGGGQTETSITLPKGKHTLQLILGDKFHIPHHPMVVSKKITVIVK